MNALDNLAFPMEADGDADDRKLFVVFYVDALVNEVKSMEAGRQVSDDVVMVKIQAPGQRDYVVHKADEGHKRRFPRQWAQYQANVEQLGSGTQLSDVPWLTPAQINDLKAMNVRTVEQLVAVPDSNGHAFMGFHGLKQRAQAFLDQAAGNAPLLKLQTELDARDAQIAQLRATVEDLAAKVNKTSGGKKVADLV